jgi:hypothetical protein
MSKEMTEALFAATMVVLLLVMFLVGTVAAVP